MLKQSKVTMLPSIWTTVDLTRNFYSHTPALRFAAVFLLLLSLDFPFSQVQFCLQHLRKTCFDLDQLNLSASCTYEGRSKEKLFIFKPFSCDAYGLGIEHFKFWFACLFLFVSDLHYQKVAKTCFANSVVLNLLRSKMKVICNLIGVSHEN